MIYILAFVISIVFSYWTSCLLLRKKYLKGYLCLMITVVIPSGLAAFRDMSIGTDTAGYVQPFFEIALSCSSYKLYQYMLSIEIMYSLLTYMVSEYTRNIAWLLFFIQFFILSFISLSVLNLKKYYLFPLAFTIYFFVFYNMSLNMTRQMMAMAVCLYAFSYLLKRKYYVSIFISLLALGFHSTAFLFLIIYPIYFILQKYANRKTKILLALGTFIVILLQDFMITFFINAGMLSSKFEVYSSSNIWGSNIPLSDFLYASFFLFLLWSLRKYKVGLSKNYHYYQVLALIGFALCFAAINSTFAVRAMYYISFLSILIIPICVYSITLNQKRFVYKLIIIIGLFLYWCMVIPYANLNETYPYSSTILGI